MLALLALLGPARAMDLDLDVHIGGEATQLEVTGIDPARGTTLTVHEVSGAREYRLEIAIRVDGEIVHADMTLWTADDGFVVARPRIVTQLGTRAQVSQGWLLPRGPVRLGRSRARAPAAREVSINLLVTGGSSAKGPGLSPSLPGASAKPRTRRRSPPGSGPRRPDGARTRSRSHRRTR
jgi:hypothetical protein